MFLIYQPTDAIYVKNLDFIDKLVLSGTKIAGDSLLRFFVSYETEEEALTRFNDILEALDADRNVYDTRKEVGYWKAKKPGPKPKAKAPAQGNPEPAPKK